MWVVAKTGGFYPSFVDECFEAVMSFPQADAQFLGQLALGDIGLGLDQFEQAITDFVGSHVFCSFGEQGGIIKVQGSRFKEKGEREDLGSRNEVKG